MGASNTLFDLLQQGSSSRSFELVTDNHKGHHSDFAPSPRVRRKRSGELVSSPVPALSASKKLSLCRWDSSSSCNNIPVKPIKQSSRRSAGSDSPPSLKRMLSHPPPATLQNVLKPVRRLSFDEHLDNICGVSSATKNMSTVDLLSSVLDNLDLLDDGDDSMDIAACPDEEIGA